MREEQQEALRKPLRDFVYARRGKLVKVKGMWTGNFVGEVVQVGATGCEFTVDGTKIWLPYCTAMNLEEATP
jgi:hypothetical protein